MPCNCPCNFQSDIQIPVTLDSMTYFVNLNTIIFLLILFFLILLIL